MAIMSIMDKIVVLKQIYNLMEDIASLTRNIINADSLSITEQLILSGCREKFMLLLVKRCDIF